MSYLGGRIQDLRKQHNLSQQDLADKTKISKSQINRYENRGVQPPADVLNKLASVLDTSIDFLINGTIDEKAKASLKDAELIKYFKEVDVLPTDEKSIVLRLIGAYVRDFKAKQAYAS